MAEQPPRYELKITASGTVRDADGNVISDDQPLETTVILTEDELNDLRERMETEH